MLWLINIVAAIILRLLHGGRMEFVFVPTDSDRLETTYRIAGPGSQPRTAFQFIKMPEGNLVNLCYSPLGFSSKRAGLQLTEFAESHYAQRINVYAISLGAQVMLNAGDSLYRRAKMIAIDPCLSRKSLRPMPAFFVTVGAVVLEIVSVLLGCIALLPIIPAEEGQYSVALWADILFNIAFGDAKQDHPTVVIKSLHNQTLDDDYLSERFERSAIEIADDVPGCGSISDPRQAPVYTEAIKKASRFAH